MSRKNQGSILIIVLLILCVSLLFITATILNLNNLNKIQSNENVYIKEKLSIDSCINLFNNLSLYGNEKGNLRGPINISINNEKVFGTISFDYLKYNSKEMKHLILNAEVDDTNGKAKVQKIAIRPVPTFNYSHFVIDVNDELGDAHVREECIGLIRANNPNNLFTNIVGSATKLKGKPYIYMQDIDINSYSYLAKYDGLYLDYSSNPTDMNIFFYDNNKIFIEPHSIIYNITKHSVIVIKNGNCRVNLIGMDSNNNYSSIKTQFNITFVTNSPIFIESDIYSKNDFIFISTFKDNNIYSAINMDINKYIEHKFIPNGVDINTSNIYYDLYKNYYLKENRIYLKSIFIATNGSFGFQSNTYNGGEHYNYNVFNTYYIMGGIIEYRSNYEMKQFEDIPISYNHIVCQRNDTYLNFPSDIALPFIAPPVAENLFSFSKYF